MHTTSVSHSTAIITACIIPNYKYTLTNKLALLIFLIIALLSMNIHIIDAPGAARGICFGAFTYYWTAQYVP